MEKKNKIISMSLKQEDLEKLDYLTSFLKHEGRSETIRASINILDLESKSIEKAKGKITSLLILTHNHSKNISQISHTYQEIIKTQFHTHLKNHKCAEFLILEGNAEEIKSLSKNFQKDKKVTLSKLIIL